MKRMRRGRISCPFLDERIAQPGAQTPLPEYAIEIVRGVDEHRRDIDSQLNTHSTGWKVKRMHAIDRNILRIATWEILYNDDVPDKVAIDEALNLSKTLSDDAAPSFIHGVLSAIVGGEGQAVPAATPLDDSDKDESDQTN